MQLLNKRIVIRGLLTMIKISYSGWVDVAEYIRDLFYDDGVQMVLNWDKLLSCKDKYEKLKEVFMHLESRSNYEYVINPEIILNIFYDKELWLDDTDLSIDRDGGVISMDVSFFRNYFRFSGEVHRGYYEGNLVYRDITLYFIDDFVGSFYDTNITYNFYPEDDEDYEIEDYLRGLEDEDINNLIKRIVG